MLLLGARGAFMVDRKFNLYRLPATMKLGAPRGAAAGRRHPQWWRYTRTASPASSSRPSGKAADGSVERQARALRVRRDVVCGAR